MWMIIGYGNTLRSDDRFGEAVCEELRAFLAADDLAEISVVHQLTPELIESISRSDAVIFVDASADLKPGQLQFLPVEQTPTSSAFSHHCTPQTLLKDAQELYGKAPPGWLCIVGGVDFELGEKLSPAVKTAVTKSVQLILEKMGAVAQI